MNYIKLDFINNKQKEMENIFMKMVNIIQINIKMVLKRGKRIYYYKNNSNKYEGDFIHDTFNGNGKYMYENEDNYIGQFLIIMVKEYCIIKTLQYN